MRFYFAKNSHGPKHLLEDIRQLIERTDYGLYDLTDWNANVALEFGYARGLGKECHILFKPGRRNLASVPTDVQGLKRIEYRKLDGFENDCLTYQLDDKILKDKLRHVDDIWHDLPEPGREARFVVAMRVLAHFKDHRWLHRTELKRLAEGSRLTKQDHNELMAKLLSRRLISGQQDGDRWKAPRDRYRTVRLNRKLTRDPFGRSHD